MACEIKRRDLAAADRLRSASAATPSVGQEGEVGVGDPIELIEKDKNSLRLSDITAPSGTASDCFAP